MAATVPALAADAERLATMGAAAVGLIPRDADERLARIIMDVAGLMQVPVPEDILPADRLGRVHFVGIGGAGLSGIARIMLARGIAGDRQRRHRLAVPRRAAGARRPDPRGHAAAHLGDGRHRGGVDRGPREQPRGRRGRRPRAAPAAPLGGARRR